ncbi:hypothetical protein ABPG74_015829 [Tetrahymena malaccensis]
MDLVCNKSDHTKREYLQVKIFFLLLKLEKLSKNLEKKSVVVFDNFQSNRTKDQEKSSDLAGYIANNIKNKLIKIEINKKDQNSRKKKTKNRSVELVSLKKRIQKIQDN